MALKNVDFVSNTLILDKFEYSRPRLLFLMCFYGELQFILSAHCEIINVDIFCSFPLKDMADSRHLSLAVLRLIAFAQQPTEL